MFRFDYARVRFYIALCVFPFYCVYSVIRRVIGFAIRCRFLLSLSV